MITKHPLSAAIFLALNSFYLSGCENKEYAAISCATGSAREAVTNCSSDSLAAVEEPVVVVPAQTGFENKGGVTGRVLGASYWTDASICFDTNQNGACDKASEAIEKIWEDGQYSFAADATSTAIENNVNLLAVREQADTSSPVALYAPAPASNTEDNIFVTPFTTLVVNETRFNPFTLDSVSAARAALISGTPSIGSETNLKGDDYLASSDATTASQAVVITGTLARAQKLRSDKHYQATAAVVDSIYRTANLDANTTTAAIDAQEPLGNVINADLTTQPESWPLGHEEEISVSIDVRNSLAVVGSQYHNRLIVFDMSEENPVRLSTEEFAASLGERDEIDAVTGASEQILTKLEIAPDAKSGVVGVEKYKKDSEEKGVGLYRADFSQPTLVPSKTFAEDNSNTSDFFAFPGLKDFAVSANGNKIVLAGEDKKVAVLSRQDFSLDRTITFTSKVRAIGIDDTGTHAFAALFGARTGLATLDLATGNESGFLATGSQYPEKIEVFSNRSTLSYYLRKGKTLFIYDISNPADPKLTDQLEASEKIKTFAFSEDGTLVLVGIVGGVLELYSLEGSAHLIDAFVTEKDAEGVPKPINDVAFVDNTRALVSMRNGLQVLDITVSPPKDWSDAEKQSWFDVHRKL